MDDNDTIIPEYSLVIDIRELPASGKKFQLAPKDEIFPAIAKRLKIPAIHELSGTTEILPTSDGANLSGRVCAILQRQCVVSLEEMEECVEEEFTIIFDCHFVEEDETDEETVINDDREPLKSSHIDLGEVLIQQLSLAMHPFPRKEGARSLSEEYGRVDEPSPFAILKNTFSGPSS